jgi:probable phosphoglycerate mutase
VLDAAASNDEEVFPAAASANSDQTQEAARGDLATFLLISHASSTEHDERVLGRAANVQLSDVGRAQASRLAERLGRLKISAVYSSPLQRAHQTAEALASRHRLEVRTREPLTELDFGEWSGLSYDTLDEISRWHVYNVYRTGTRPPGGEMLVEAQTRMVAEINRLSAVHSPHVVAVVSHVDPLRALIGHFAGIPIELLERIELAPASVSVLSLTTTGARLRRLNDTGDLHPT